MSITADACAEQYGFFYRENGGVASARGFRACGIHAGFRENPGRLDMALVVADETCPCAGVFTKNKFCAAPVQVCREHLGATDEGTIGDSYGTARAVIINSGIANAATGALGKEAAETVAAMTAEVVGCEEAEVLVASTGVIGVELPLGPFEEGLPDALNELSRDGGSDAARAIMTTDTHPKECAVTFSGDGCGWDGCIFTVGGMSKGAGMIMPNMATMIAVLTTDAPIAPADLHKALVKAVGKSFNKVTVDSDTSTNDTCILFASGAAAQGEGEVEVVQSEGEMQGESTAGAEACQKTFQPDSPAMEMFQQALEQVCVTLARAMASDGEGASRLVTVNVQGAATPEDADLAARAVANSPLVKTAIAGHDANWGRIAAALGKSGAEFRQEDVAIVLMGLPVMLNGLPLEFDEDEASALFEHHEIAIDIDLGAGECATTVWTCDLTHEYVSINGDYRS